MRDNVTRRASDHVAHTAQKTEVEGSAHISGVGRQGGF